MWYGLWSSTPDPSSSERRGCGTGSINLLVFILDSSSLNLSRFDKERPHNIWMNLALSLARSASRRGEVPVGAVVVLYEDEDEGSLISTGINLKESLSDPTAHAEMIALRQAAQILRRWRLSHCTLYVTTEPCSMCVGAALSARISRIIYGCANSKFGACGSVVDLCRDPRFNHRMICHGGLNADESAQLMTTFFQSRRAVLNAVSQGEE